MMTAPFGPALEAALRETRQGGKLYCCKGAVVNPRFFCCLSGTNVGVAKDPVAVLAISPLRGCYDPGGGTGDTFTADVSHSWSPSSTINAWSVAWGDGAVDAVVPPAVGTHQYTLPGTYTITLTVTDLLGATGLDTVQVEALDCVDIPDIEAFCGCGLSGVWHTDNGGRLWEQAGLAGVEVYDLDVSPLTFGMENVQLWAATANGLYKSLDSGVTWQRMDQYIGLPVNTTIQAVLCSKFDESEIYVAAYDAVGLLSYLYRSTDGGETWQGLPTGILSYRDASTVTQEYPAGAGTFPMITPPWLGHLFTIWNNTVNFSGTTWDIRSRVAPGNWTSIANAGIHASTNGIAAGSTLLWAAGWLWDATKKGRTSYNGAAWTQYNAPGGIGWMGVDAIRLADGNMAISWYDATADPTSYIEIINQAGTVITTYTHNSPAAIWDDWTMRGIAEGYGELFSFFAHYQITGTTYVIAQVGTWVYEWEGTFKPTVLVAAEDTMWAALDGQTALLKRLSNGAWVTDGMACPDAIRFAWGDPEGRLYIGAGTKIYRHGRYGYEIEADFGAGHDVYQFIRHSGSWFACVTQAGLYRIYSCLATSTPLTLTAVGRTNVLDTDESGAYVYVAALTVAGRPVILRVDYDLSGLTTVYLPGAGTWGGVKCDYYYVGRVWISGDFGAAGNKIRRSNNDGSTWANVTPGGLGAGEVVRSVLPDRYDPDDVVAILNTALRAYRTRDGGAAVPTWANVGAIAFACHCGERDWIEPQNVFIGRAAAGAAHLRYSYNLGANWLERSAGLTANAPVVAMVIVG